MKIYTKTGDTGNSSLYNGTRVSKTDPIFSTLGEIDTLNAQLGHLISKFDEKAPLSTEIQNIQKKLLSLSSEIAKAQETRNTVTPDDTTHLEKRIDYLMNQTAPLTHLVLPGGSDAGSFMHIIRTQARKVERSFLDLEDKPKNNSIGAYLNRISDYFFALARYQNHQDQHPEQEWC